MESGEAQGTYLTHCTLPDVGQTGDLMADKALAVLEETESKKSLKAVLCDNTSVNTGAI